MIAVRFCSLFMSVSQGFVARGLRAEGAHMTYGTPAAHRSTASNLSGSPAAANLAIRAARPGDLGELVLVDVSADRRPTVCQSIEVTSLTRVKVVKGRINLFHGTSLCTP